MKYTVNAYVNIFKVHQATAYRWRKNPPPYLEYAKAAYTNRLKPLTSPQAARYWKSLGVTPRTGTRWNTRAPLVARYAAAYIKWRIENHENK